MDEFEASDCGPVELLSQHLPGKAEEDCENHQSGYLLSWLRFELTTS
jgi:hypothetical protein